MNDSPQTTEDQILVFTLDELAYALPLHTVVRVIHAVEVRHLSNAPEIIAGIINVQGQIIPVADIRKRFGLAERETDPDDRLIIAATGKRKIALFADTVSGIKDMTTGQFVNSKEALPFAGYIKGVAKVDNELILIYDLEQFLSLDEENVLEKALKAKIK
ncbi:MAG: purine-binding chemotaxis protein CheW [Bacteroidetes bacterium]|nr:MAG: purine-binding chemotaxis protein CheW [Bacteroidota bacterium]